MKLIFTPRALTEARDSYAWYESKESGLGEEFYRSLSAALSFIERNPEVPRLVYRHFRRVMLRRFPFAVIYRIDQETIHIFSVFHCAQHPGKWRQ